MIDKIEKLNESHDLSKFDCGENKANDYIKNKALLFQKKGLNFTWLAFKNNNLVGFYTLSMSSTKAKYFKDTQDIKHAIPCTLLGWIGVDKKMQGCGLGRILMMSIFKRVFHSYKDGVTGFKALILDALNPQLVKYYESLEFDNLKGTNKMVMTIQNIESILRKNNIIND